MVFLQRCNYHEWGNVLSGWKKGTCNNSVSLFLMAFPQQQTVTRLSVVPFCPQPYISIGLESRPFPLPNAVIHHTDRDPTPAIVRAWSPLDHGAMRKKGNHEMDTLYLSNDSDSWDPWSARRGRAPSTLPDCNDAKQLHSILGRVLALYLVEGKGTWLLASIICKLNCLLSSQKTPKWETNKIAESYDELNAHKTQTERLYYAVARKGSREWGTNTPHAPNNSSAIWHHVGQPHAWSAHLRGWLAIAEIAVNCI